MRCILPRKGAGKAFDALRIGIKTPSLDPDARLALHPKQGKLALTLIDEMSSTLCLLMFPCIAGPDLFMSACPSFGFHDCHSAFTNEKIEKLFGLGICIRRQDDVEIAPDCSLAR